MSSNFVAVYWSKYTCSSSGICGPTTGPVPPLYTELLKSCKADPLCTFLLRLSLIPLREIGETALNVLLQVLPFDMKHMHVSDRMEFASRLCIFVYSRRHNSSDLLPLLLSQTVAKFSHDSMV